ncbi:MAG: right-handed parallel beta-helix repeat-containing protein [Sedimentisphaerales bacterium]|nr:right-handed parallel beta-helix repeat-containing protein [Sedimentisphaerales bacterium]
MSVYVKRYGKALAVVVLAVVVGLLVVLSITRQAVRGEEPAEVNLTDRLTEDKHEPNVISRVVTELNGSRDYNHRLWRMEKELEVIDPNSGKLKIETEVSKIVEVGCGICYQEPNGNWQVAEPVWRATADGFVMDRADYRLQIGTTLGEWLSYTVDDVTMQMRPVRLQVVQGNYQVDIARINPLVAGVIDAEDPSRLVFANAFGAGIDLELQAQRDGFHQNVIFNRKPILLERLDTANALVRIYTELNLDDCVDNQEVGVIIEGREVEDFEQLNTTPTREDIEFVKVWHEGEVRASSDRHRFGRSEVFDAAESSSRRGITAYKQLFRDTDDKIYLIETLDNSFFQEAKFPVTWDYVTRNGAIEEDEDWYADATYYVSSDITLTNGAKLRIEPGTIVKLNGADIDAGGGELVAQGKPYEYIVFTSKNDNDFGDTISGSSGNPSSSDWDGLEIDEDSTVEFCKIAYAGIGITLEASATSSPIQHNIITNCGSGIDFAECYSGTHQIFNNLITNCSGTGISIYGGGSVIGIKNNTVDNCDSGICGSEISGTCYVQNNLITNYDTESIYELYGVTNNGFYGDSGAGSSKVILTVSPYDTTNTYLGNYFLNNTSSGGADLIDEGSGTVGDWYAEPNDWSIKHVSGSDRLFTSTTSLSSDTTWEPNQATVDTGTVDIGYHHPRVDYVLYADVTLNSSKTLTIEPGTVVAMGGVSSGTGDLILNGTLNCEGDPFDGGYVRLMQRALACANWDGVKYRNSNKAKVDFDGGSSQSSINFTCISGLSYGLYFQTGYMNYPIHDVILKRNYCGICAEAGYSDDEYEWQNNLFLENGKGFVGEINEGGVWLLENCTFDRNTTRACEIPLNEEFGINITVKQNIFTNTGLDASGQSQGEALWEDEVDCEGVEESYNGFFRNQYHYYKDTEGVVTLDATDYAGEPNASSPSKILDEDDFYQGWSDFADRFYLPSGSKLINAGDPNVQNAEGYTTSCSPSGSADTGTIDIGYRYPSAHDTDADGIIDFTEAKNGTLQNDYDSDDDGLVDGGGGLISTATYANGYDVDEDGYVDGEADLGTDPTDDDSDDDGMPDGWEHNYNLNPLNDADASGDADSDGLSNLLEYQLNLDPTDADSDKDGMPDGWEYSHGLTPDVDDAAGDYDSDGYSNIVEYVHESLPEVYSNPGDPNDVLVPMKIYVPAGVISIQSAISGSLDGDEIIVFPGTYYENIDFMGKGVTLRSMAPESASVVSATVINGGGDDVVVFENSEGSGCCLDGFTITAGTDGISCSGSEPGITNCRIIDNADSGLCISGGAAVSVSGCEISGNQLGAVRIESASAELVDCFVHDNTAVQGAGAAISGDSTITVSGCVFEQNFSTGNGGGIYVANPLGAVIADSTFKDNQAQLNGGGLYNLNSSVVLERCTVIENEAVNGAGLFSSNGYASLSSSVIYGNLADGEGGGIYSELSDPNLINCTVIKNQAVKGGAIANHNSSPRIINSILWHNLASEAGGEIYNQGAGQAWLRYCDVEDCGVSELGQWESSLGINGGYNLEIEPAFVDMDDPAGKDGVFGSRDDGLYLCCRKDPGETVGGGLLDRADGNFAPALDRAGKGGVDVPYLANLGTDPKSYVDLGAYESPAIWYVNQAGSGAHEGDSWDNAFAYVQDALKKADDITSNFDPNNFDPATMCTREIWVAKGTYYPYNKFATYLVVNFRTFQATKSHES